MNRAEIELRAEKLGFAACEAQRPRTDDPYREFAEPPYHSPHFIESATNLSSAWLRGWGQGRSMPPADRPRGFAAMDPNSGASMAKHFAELRRTNAQGLEAARRKVDVATAALAHASTELERAERRVAGAKPRSQSEEDTAQGVMSAGDLQYRGYEWSHTGEDDRITLGGDAALVNRREGYEILYFLNGFLARHKLGKAGGQKAERAIHGPLPGHLRSRAHIRAWLELNWDSLI